MNTNTIFFLLLSIIALVLLGIVAWLYATKRREDAVLTEKTLRQVSLILRHSQLSFML